MEKIILFDGVCNLCDATVQWVIKHDKKQQFTFASLQGKTGEAMKTHPQWKPIDSIVLVEGEVMYTESTAVLRILKHLGGIWSVFSVLRFTPKPLRDVAYRFVAKRRIQWFGKKETCLVPTPEHKKRFLD